MKKWILGVAALSLLLISNMTFADGESSKKKKSAFSLETPNGWVEDNSIALDFRLNAVYYPQNTNWNESSTVIYTNIEDLEGGQSVKDIIEPN